MAVVNAVRDSTIADSLYLGEQNLFINNEFYIIDVDNLMDLSMTPPLELKVLEKILFLILYFK